MDFFKLPFHLAAGASQVKRQEVEGSALYPETSEVWLGCAKVHAGSGNVWKGTVRVFILITEEVWSCMHGGSKGGSWRSRASFSSLALFRFPPAKCPLTLNLVFIPDHKSLMLFCWSSDSSFFLHTSLLHFHFPLHIPQLIFVHHLCIYSILLTLRSLKTLVIQDLLLEKHFPVLVGMYL